MSSGDRSHPRLSILSCAALVLVLAPALRGDSARRGAGDVLRKVEVPMRDGMKLAADVYLPEGDGPFPVVVARSVYGRGNEALARPFTSRGMAFVPQDTRGRGDSEGRDRVFADDGWSLTQDGADTIAWVREQSWCNGKVGTWGGSALGITQIWLAAAGADVDFQHIAVAASRFYGDLAYQGGVWRRGLCEPWLTMQKTAHVIRLWKSHPYLATFWTSMDATRQAASVTAPALHLGGWWDIFAQGTIDNFVSRHEHGGPGARGRQVLVMGPWAHGGPGGPRKLGDLELRDNYRFDVEKLAHRLYAHYLRGVDDGVEREAAVHYYTLGADDDTDAPGNEWRTAASWPPFAVQKRSLWLAADGALRTKGAPSAENDSAAFTYDPSDPCPTRGGANLALPAGPFDQRRVSSRPDVLRFVTAPLAAPLEATGRVKVRLYVSSDAPDTDFTAKLIDVYPDGREILLLDSIQRVKLRRGFRTPEPLPPGSMGEVEIDLWSISVVFAKGHRIGLHVSSSNYPRFEKNPNSGDDFPTADNSRAARNTVWFGAEHPSALILEGPVGD